MLIVSRILRGCFYGSVVLNKGTLMVQKDSTGMLLWFTRVEEMYANRQ